MADTQGLVDRAEMPGTRPYTTVDEKANQMKGLTNMGGRQESRPPTPPPTPEGPPNPGPPMQFPAPPAKPPLAGFGPQAVEDAHRRFIESGPPLEDPLSVFSPVKGALDGVGSLIAGGLALEMRTNPKARGVMKAAGAVMGAAGTAMQAPLGAEAVGADVAGAITGQGDTSGEFAGAYLRGSNYPEDNPMAAVLHGFQAAEQKRAESLGQVMSDPQRDVGERFRAAVGGGTALLIENFMLGPELTVAGELTGLAARTASRASGAALGAAERSVGNVAPGAGYFAGRQAERVTAARKLPDELARAKPRYGRSEIEFESDVDKALYIVGNDEIKSARDPEYMAYLKEHFPNASDGEIRVMGKQVREQLRNVKYDEGIRKLPATTMAKNADSEGVAPAPPKGPSEVDQWRTYQGPPVTAKFQDGKSTRVKAGAMGYIVSEDAGGQVWQFETTTGRARARIKTTEETVPEVSKKLASAAAPKAVARSREEDIIASIMESTDRPSYGGPLSGTPRGATPVGPKASSLVGQTVEFATKTGRSTGKLVGKNENGRYLIDVGGGKTIERRNIHAIRDEATVAADAEEVINSIKKPGSKKADPPAPPGMTRLYRGEGAPRSSDVVPGPQEFAGRWYTTDPKYAKQYGDVHSILVPTKDLAEYNKPAQDYLGPIFGGKVKVSDQFIVPADKVAEARALKKEDVKAADAEEVINSITTKLPPAEIGRHSTDLLTKAQGLKPPVTGFTRLWRGEPPPGTPKGKIHDASSVGLWFTGRSQKAASYATSYGPMAIHQGLQDRYFRGDLYYVDVPTSDLPKYSPQKSGVLSMSETPEYILPSGLAKQRKSVLKGAEPPKGPPSKPPAPPAAQEPPPEPPSRRPTPTEAERTYMRPEDAARWSSTIPLSERNAIIDEITGGRINTSRLDPNIAAHFADAMKRDPEKFSHFTERVSDPEIIARAANFLGFTTEQMAERLSKMGFGKPGEIAAFMYSAQVRVVQLIDDYARSAGVSEEAAAQAYTDLVEFSSKVAGANSEVARTLRIMQLDRQLALTGAIRQREIYAKADSAVKAVEKEHDRAKQKVAVAVGKGDFNAVKEAEKSRSQWESKVDRARADREDAKTELVDRGKKARAAAYRKVVDEFGDDSDMAKLIAKVDPENPIEIAKILGQQRKYTLGEKYITAVMSGAYSGPLGHVRSAIGATMNVADEVATSGVAEMIGLPGFTRGEFKARLFGLMEANRTFWGDNMNRGMLHDYWVERVSPEQIANAVSLEDIHGPVLTGKARPFGMMLEAHGFYHATGFHFIAKTELYALLYRRAVKMVGEGADKATLSSVYHELATKPPAELVDEAVRVATDRRYLARQNPVYENMLKIVGAEVPLPLLGRTPIFRPYFVAARFGVGFAGRQMEFGLGGGLARAAWIAKHDIPALEKRAMQTESKLRAMKELGAGTPDSRLRARAAEIEKSGDPSVREAAMRSIDPERDFLMREASKAGVRGAVGASLLGVGYVMAMNGSLHRDGFETWVDTPAGPMNLTWLMPYSSPWVFASIIHDAVSKKELTGDNIDQAAMAAVSAMSQNIVESDSLSQIGIIDDVIQGRGGSKAMRQAGQLAARLVAPGFSVAAREGDRILDGIAKDPRSMQEYLVYYMPLARRALRPKLDPMTGEVVPDQPQGAQRLNPAAVQTQPPSGPVQEQDQKFRQVDPTYKGLSSPAQTWGSKPEDKVKLDPDQEWEYTKRTGEARQRILSALLKDPQFTGEKDVAKQREMWAKADNIARREARRDYASELMRTGDPKNVLQYAKAAYDANGTGRAETALWLLSLKNDHTMTSPVEAALDKIIREHEAPNKSNITVKTYEGVMQDVSDYLHIVPFTKGSPAEWRQYREQKKEYDALHQQDFMAAIRYYQQHPLLREYDAARNIQRDLFLAKHPKLQPFIGGTEYTWLR